MELQVWLPYSIHTDLGRKFETELFQHSMRSIQSDKKRTISFHPQSNWSTERMSCTLLNVIPKNIGKEQAQWFCFLLFVSIAYRSLVHDSIRFAPNILVLGHEILLPLDLLYPAPRTEDPTDVMKYVLQKQAVFHRALELVRRFNTT